jgi:predicted MarR family transcription regulator
MEVSSMRKSFEDFRELVLGDVSLQEDLQAITDPGKFVSRVVELAGVHGFEFNAADVEEGMRRARRKWFERGV